MAFARLTKRDIEHLFSLLDADLAAHGQTGELYLVGGAVMCLAFGARDATTDVDALFQPSQAVRAAAVRVAAKAGVSDAWLNDAVKGYLSPRGGFDGFLDRPNLKVFVAQPQYLLAMKCAAMRLGREFHDLDDVRFLLRYLNIETTAAAMEVVLEYFDETQLLPKTRLVLEELLGR